MQFIEDRVVTWRSFNLRCLTSGGRFCHWQSYHIHLLSIYRIITYSIVLITYFLCCFFLVCVCCYFALIFFHCCNSGCWWFHVEHFPSPRSKTFTGKNCSREFNVNWHELHGKRLHGCHVMSRFIRNSTSTSQILSSTPSKNN